MVRGFEKVEPKNPPTAPAMVVVPKKVLSPYHTTKLQENFAKGPIEYQKRFSLKPAGCLPGDKLQSKYALPKITERSTFSRGQSRPNNANKKYIRPIQILSSPHDPTVSYHFFDTNLKKNRASVMPA